MKIIIPAKRNSTRVPNKNWRAFFNGQNLVEIKIEQLLKSVNAKDIFLSTDHQEQVEMTQQYGIQLLPRNALFASDDTPWPDALHGIISDTAFHSDESIAWVEVINPLFDNYSALFAKWEEVKHIHDSIVLASPMNKFLMDENAKPINFQFGKWHAMSQNMKPWFAWDSACIMRKRDMLYFSYPIGKSPFLFSTQGHCIDIDTMDDFEMAQYFYSKKHTL